MRRPLKSLNYPLLGALILLGVLFSYSACTRMGPEEKEARSDLLILREALEKYHEDMDRYPTEAEQLSVLFMDPNTPGWKGPYLRSDSLIDPWQQPYVYGQFREVIFVASTGPNGEPETPEVHLQQGLSGGDDIVLLMPNFEP